MENKEIHGKIVVATGLLGIGTNNGALVGLLGGQELMRQFRNPKKAGEERPLNRNAAMRYYQLLRRKLGLRPDPAASVSKENM